MYNRPLCNKEISSTKIREPSIHEENKVNMVPLMKRPVMVALALVVVAKASGIEDSSCLSAKTAQDCKSQVEEGTGDRCVWCTCRAVPSECLGASLAKVRP